MSRRHAQPAESPLPLCLELAPAMQGAPAARLVTGSRARSGSGVAGACSCCSWWPPTGAPSCSRCSSSSTSGAPAPRPPPALLLPLHGQVLRRLRDQDRAGHRGVLHLADAEGWATRREFGARRDALRRHLPTAVGKPFLNAFVANCVS